MLKKLLSFVMVLLIPFLLQAQTSDCADQYDGCMGTAQTKLDNTVDNCKWWQINCKRRAQMVFVGETAVCAVTLRECIRE